MFKELIRQKEHMVLPDLAQDLAQVSNTHAHCHLCLSSHKHASLHVTNHANLSASMLPCTPWSKHAFMCVIESKLADSTSIIWHACLACTYKVSTAMLGSNWGTEPMKLLVISVKYPRKSTVQCLAGGGGT